MISQKYIGIDPGKSGAIAVLNQKGQVEYMAPIPATKAEVDFMALRDILVCYTETTEYTHICIEQVHAVFGSSAKATFSFGYICGAIEGIVASLGLTYTMVQPKIWQKELWQGIPEKRKPPITIKNGKNAGKSKKGPIDTKLMSLIAAKRLFPNESFLRTERCKNPDDGLIDAVLIAEYCRRKFKLE